MQIYVRNVSQPMVIAQAHKIVWTPVYLSADGGEEMESVSNIQSYIVLVRSVG